MGGEHRFEQRLRAARRFLRNMGEARVLGITDGAVIGMKLARDQAEKRRLARAIASDKADLMTSGMAAVACSKSGRPSMRKLRSLICSMTAKCCGSPARATFYTS